MFNLSITPAQIEIVVKPGSSLTQAYEIKNNSDQFLILTPSIEPWLPTDTTGSVTYHNVPANPHLRFSLSNTDLTLGQNFRLPPNSSRQLVLKIKSDSNTPLADSYYTFFLSQNQENALLSSPQTQAKIGAHILISNSSVQEPEVSLAINDFFVSPHFKDTFFSTLNFQAQIENLSDHFSKTTGSLTLKKADKTIQNFDLFPHNVLAHHSRDLSCTLYFDQEKQPPQATSCTLRPPFWPGFYTATLTLSQTQQSISFYVFPYSLTFALLLLTAIFIVFKKTKSPLPPL